MGRLKAAPPQTSQKLLGSYVAFGMYCRLCLAVLSSVFDHVADFADSAVCPISRTTANEIMLCRCPSW